MTLGVLLRACCLWVLVGLCIMVVLCGYQGADTDAEQLALTEQLFDASLGELGRWWLGGNPV